MTFFFLWLTIAVVDWIAVAKDWRKIDYFVKPGAILALLLWLALSGGLGGHLTWFALGLVCSLVGDVFLMLPRERFVAGLVAFLLAHLAYLVGFNPSLPPLNLASLILAPVPFVIASQIYRRIARGLEAGGQGRLKLPILAYMIVISLMLLSALLTLVRPEWSAVAALSASGGALLFMLSDTLLAWNKFVAPLRHNRVLVRMSYHLGQLLITLGAMLHFL